MKNFLLSGNVPMCFPPCPQIFKHQCNEKLFHVIVGTPHESSRVTAVEVWQQMSIKFSILFSFIIETLTGLKFFITWQPGYQGCPQESGSRKPFPVLAPRPWDSKFRKPLGFWFHSQNCLWVGAQLTEITRENHAVLADHRQIINHMCKIYASTVSLPGIFRFVCLIHPYRPCTQLPWIYRVDSFVHFVTVNSTVYSNVKICSPVL